LARRSLDEALATAVTVTLQDLLEKGRLLAPATVALYNECHGHG
jgi:hypothetical protein